MNTYFQLHFNCRCLLAGFTTMGEQLLDVVRELGTSKDLLIVAPPQMNDPSYLNAVALAIKFRDRGAGFIFRAIFEGWSKERIIKEMY